MTLCKNKAEIACQILLEQDTKNILNLFRAYRLKTNVKRIMIDPDNVLMDAVKLYKNPIDVTRSSFRVFILFSV